MSVSGNSTDEYDPAMLEAGLSTGQDKCDEYKQKMTKNLTKSLKPSSDPRDLEEGTAYKEKSGGGGGDNSLLIMLLVVIVLILALNPFGGGTPQKSRDIAVPDAKSTSKDGGSKESGSGSGSGSDDDDSEKPYLVEATDMLQENVPYLSTITSAAWWPFAKAALVFGTAYQLFFYGWFSANAAMDRDVGSMNTTGINTVTWYNPVSWVGWGSRLVGGTAADEFSANLSGDPRKHVNSMFNNYGGVAVGRTLWDDKLESTYGSTLQSRGEYQRAWNNSWTGTILGASDSYEKNWLKQMMASAVYIFGGYKVLDAFYPDYSGILLDVVKTTGNFMNNVADTASSWSYWMVGTTLSGVSYVTPFGSSAVKHLADKCLSGEKHEGTRKKIHEAADNVEKALTDDDHAVKKAMNDVAKTTGRISHGIDAKKHSGVISPITKLFGWGGDSGSDSGSDSKSGSGDDKDSKKDD